jgi:hypothetical protein
VDDGLKQRIVGAFVLVAIGVVFIPVVFDRERIEVLNRKTQIPPAPHIEPISIPAPIQPIAIEKLSPPPTAYIPNDRSIQPDTIEQKYWMIKERRTVGCFSWPVIVFLSMQRLSAMS